MTSEENTSDDTATEAAPAPVPAQSPGADTEERAPEAEPITTEEKIERAAAQDQEPEERYE